MSRPELTISQAQDVVRQTSGNYEQFGFVDNEDALLDGMLGEIGEYLQAEDKNKEGELADVMYYLFSLADKSGYNIADMLDYVFTKNIMRTNPVIVKPIQEETGLSGRELYKECKIRSDSVNGGVIYKA